VSSLPAKQGAWDMASFVRERAKPVILPLLPASTDWGSFETAIRAQLMAVPALADAFAKNPNSGLLALIKCARLGLDLNPAKQHYCLIPYGGVIEGQAMYKGWQELVMSSGNVEWIQSDVVYKAEVNQGVPFFDPITQKPNHVPHDFERDDYKDDDIVGAYCSIKVIGQERLVSRLLTRGDINKRRAVSKAPNSPGWTKWFKEMCLAKVLKATCSSGRVPLTKQLQLAVRLDDQDEEPGTPVPTPVKPLPTAPTRLQAPPPPAQTGGEFMFDARKKEPLPTDDAHRQDLLGAIATEAVHQELTPLGTAEIASKALKRDVQPDQLESLTKEDLDQVLSLLMESRP